MHTSPLTILALDDDADDLHVLERSLRKVSDYEIVYVPCLSAEHAVRELETRPVDLVFMDYYLGAEHGDDVIRKLRARGWDQPTIAITGRSDTQEAARLFQAGACDYLSKTGLAPDKLRESIHAALHRYEDERRRRAEERHRLEAGKLEAVGTLAGGIAHDFNNMLTGLLGYLELAKLKCEGRGVMDDLAHMEDTCKHMVELARRMLSFVSEGSGSREIVHVGNLLAQSEMLLRPSVPENVTFSVACDDESMAVLAWPANLQEALLAVLQNGLDAMPEGGRLELHGNLYVQHEDHASVVDLPDGEYACIRVSDTGSGIDPSVRGRIFEPFFTTKRRGTQKGQGLGLAFVWKCVSDLGGVVKVESNLSAGTTIAIYLPLSPTCSVLGSAERVCGPLRAQTLPSAAH